MFFDSKQEEKMIYISLVLCLFLLELSGCNTPAGKAWTPVPSTENGEFVAKLKTTKKQKRGGSSVLRTECLLLHKRLGIFLL
jgi:hypothetical protein